MPAAGIYFGGPAALVGYMRRDLVEIETAKSLVELPSPYAGTVTELHAAEGDNDCLVSVRSSTWGEHLGTWPADHFHILNRRLLIEWKKRTGDVRPYYAALLEGEEVRRFGPFSVDVAIDTTLRFLNATGIVEAEWAAARARSTARTRSRDRRSRAP